MASAGKSNVENKENLENLNEKLKAFLNSIDKNHAVQANSSITKSSNEVHELSSVLRELNSYVSDQVSIDDIVQELPHLGQYLGSLVDEPVLHRDSEVFQLWFRCMMLIYRKCSELEKNIRNWIKNQLRKFFTIISSTTASGKLGADRMKCYKMGLQEIQQRLRASDSVISQEVIPKHREIRSVIQPFLSTASHPEETAVMVELLPFLDQEEFSLYRSTSDKTGMHTRPPCYKSASMLSSREDLEAKILCLVERSHEDGLMLSTDLGLLLHQDDLSLACASDESLYVSAIEILSSLLIQTQAADVILKIFSALHQTVLSHRQSVENQDKGWCPFFLHPRLQIFSRLYNSLPSVDETEILVHHLQDVVSYWPDVTGDSELQLRLQICLFQLEVWFYHCIWLSLNCDNLLVCTVCKFLCCFSWPLQKETKEYNKKKVPIEGLVLQLRELMLRSALNSSDFQLLATTLSSSSQGSEDSSNRLSFLLMMAFILQAPAGLKNLNTLLSLVAKDIQNDKTALLQHLVSSLDRFIPDFHSLSKCLRTELRELLQFLIQSVRETREIENHKASGFSQKTGIVEDRTLTTAEKVLHTLSEIIVTESVSSK